MNDQDTDEGGDDHYEGKGDNDEEPSNGILEAASVFAVCLSLIYLKPDSCKSVT